MDLVIYNAGFFKRDVSTHRPSSQVRSRSPLMLTCSSARNSWQTIEKLSFEDSKQMYAVCAIAPTFIASALLPSSFAPHAIFLNITTEGGSIGLRTVEEGGGNYAHHGSKAAQNMVTKLLSFDLGKQGVTVLAIHRKLSDRVDIISSPSPFGFA